MKTIHPPLRKTFRRWQVALLATALLATASFAVAQSVVFTENMGIPTGNTAITNYVTGIAPATFENVETLTYGRGGAANAADVRSTSASSGYPGASGGGNVFFTTSATGASAPTDQRGFSIGSISAASQTSLQLTFGYRKESGTALPNLSVDYWNGSSWVTIANAAAELFNEAANAPVAWYLTKTLSLPVGAQINDLQLRFVKSGSVSLRIDDVKLTAATTAPTITTLADLSTFSTLVGTASAPQSFSVSAVNLTTAITASAPLGFEVSSDNVVFASTAALPAAGGLIYARISPSAASGEFASNITLSSTGATDVTVPVSASVRPASLALPYGPDTFETTSFPWYSYTVAGNRNWTRGTLENNSYMQINGFGSSAPSNAWLILGPFDIPSGAQGIVAAFDIQKAYGGPDDEFNLKFSTDYSGVGDPTAATWTTVPFTKPASVGNTGSSTVMTPSGALSLPGSLAGQSGVFIAFQLQAATTDATTSQWRVDNFELFTSNLPVISLLVNPSTIDEGSFATGSVTLPAVPDIDVNVTVTSADATLVQIEGGASAVITIPANTDPPVATFSVTTTRDWIVGPDQPVQITADGGASYEFGQTIVTVKNIDVPGASLTSSGYTQDFTTFTSQATLPLGWSLVAAVQTYSAWGDANTTSGAKFSSAPANVFGYQHTSSTGIAQQILTLRNDTGSTISELVVSYRGRMARANQTRNPAYTVSVGGFTFPALAYSTSEGDGVLCVANITGLNVEPDQTVQVIWSSDRGVVTGTSRQIGVSDVSVTIGSAPLPPAVRSLVIPAASIGQASATAEANVVADQGSEITSRGFVYALTSVNADPTLGGEGVTNLPEAFAEIGPMIATLSGLSPGTQYSVKAYATSANGTGYTAAQAFVTISAPIVFAGTYGEAFNNFTAVTSPDLAGGSVKTGWTAVSSGGIQSYGGSWTTSSTVGGFYGGVSNPGALGYQPTTSSGTLTVTCRMVNNTAAPLTQLYVKYLGRTQMTANARIPTWAVTVAGVASSELGYSTSAGVDETKSALVTGLNVPAGSAFEITWVSDQGSGTESFRRIGLANVLVSTSPIPEAAISVSGTLSSFSATEGSPSASQSFAASGTGISGDITVTAPANYQVSLNDSVFSSSVTLPSANGTVASTTVYVRIAATAPVGNPAGEVSLSSSGATTQNIAVTGTVSSGGSAYDTWASGFGLDPATTGAPTADPDGDSFSNAQEYAFGTNPTQGNGSLLSTTASGGNLVVTWLERPDVTYNVQSTTNLATTAFANDGAVSVVNGPTEPAPPAGYTRKQITVPASGSKFYRVSAATP